MFNGVRVPTALEMESLKQGNEKLLTPFGRRSVGRSQSGVYGGVYGGGQGPGMGSCSARRVGAAGRAGDQWVLAGQQTGPWVQYSGFTGSREFSPGPGLALRRAWVQPTFPVPR
jgi:hypothetical protein